MIVSLYIKTPKFQDVSVSLVNDFKDRVIADGGTFEAASCCLATIQSLGGSFAYADSFNRIELFEDETISLTSSIQNISDISKVFTDYTQSFTIPASHNNNEIFRHWYENSLDDGFDQRQRYDGYIEIDTKTFRVGRWQLESATIKNNRIENYKITFYGELKSLTDKFGEDKLKDIEEINEFSINYNGTNVINSITNTNNPDVTFPLISSDRVWQYGSGNQNINNSSHRIHYTELFPAIKISRILNAIENKYGVTFSGQFLTESRFNLAYLWLKNSEAKVLTSKTKKQLIPMVDESGNDFFEIENNTLTVLGFTSPTAANAQFQMQVTFTGNTESTMQVFKDGTLFTTINGSGTSITFNINQSLLPGTYQFFLQTNIGTNYIATASATYFDLTTFTNVQLFSNSVSFTIPNILDLTVLSPDMKVSEFLSGILKMFNLTAFSENGINFTLEQLENWYYLGNVKDFSQYTTTDLDFERIKPFKRINFEYQKSENFLNRNFFIANAREYGDLSYFFNNEGSDFSIKLPFENMLFNKFTGTNLQVGYALNSDFNTYVPKGVILYLYENTSCSFFINNGTSTVQVTNYNVMGQDVLHQTNTHTLNWGVEISSYLLQNINRSLFNDYYLAYLSNLYSLKSRMVKVKMRLPYTELLNLKLNDRIVIRDKRYIINSYTTNLINFEVSMELIQDFRSINFNNSQFIVTDSGGKTLRINTTSNSKILWTIDKDADKIIKTITSENEYVDVEINENEIEKEKIAILESNFGDKIIIKQQW